MDSVEHPVEQSCLNWADKQLIALSAVLVGIQDSSAALSPAIAADPAAQRFGQPPVSQAQIQQLSPGALAYVGDAIYELYIRTRYLFPAKRLQTYHQQVVAQVRAESQASHLAQIQPYLTEAEQTIVRRARNAAAKGPKRVDPDIYQQATGLEALLGYLYLSDPQRLLDLLRQLGEEIT
jgi:ribonuclease III family protein